jgi:hypothetical protein
MVPLSFDKIQDLPYLMSHLQAYYNQNISYVFPFIQTIVHLLLYLDDKSEGIEKHERI